MWLDETRPKKRRCLGPEAWGGGIKGEVNAVRETEAESANRQATGTNQLSKRRVHVNQSHGDPEEQRVIWDLGLECSVHRVHVLFRS